MTIVNPGELEQRLEFLKSKLARFKDLKERMQRPGDGHSDPVEIPLAERADSIE